MVPGIRRVGGESQPGHHFATMRKPDPETRTKPLEQTTVRVRQNSMPRRFGVRFDLEDEEAENGQQHQLKILSQQPPVQFYRDLAGNVKKVSGN